MRIQVSRGFVRVPHPQHSRGQPYRAGGHNGRRCVPDRRVRRIFALCLVFGVCRLYDDPRGPDAWFGSVFAVVAAVAGLCHCHERRRARQHETRPTEERRTTNVRPERRGAAVHSAAGQGLASVHPPAASVLGGPGGTSPGGGARSDRFGLPRGRRLGAGNPLPRVAKLHWSGPDRSQCVESRSIGIERLGGVGVVRVPSHLHGRISTVATQRGVGGGGAVRPGLDGRVLGVDGATRKCVRVAVVLLCCGTCLAGGVFGMERVLEAARHVARTSVRKVETIAIRNAPRGVESQVKHFEHGFGTANKAPNRFRSSTLERTRVVVTPRSLSPSEEHRVEFHPFISYQTHWSVIVLTSSESYCTAGRVALLASTWTCTSCSRALSDILISTLSHWSSSS